MNKDKRIDVQTSKEIYIVPDNHHDVIHVPSNQDGKSTKVAIPLLWLTIAGTLFLLAYAGPDIGNVLAYLVIPALSFFPSFMVWERFGKVAGILAGLLIVSVLAPVYGSTIITNSISFFTSLQKISQGVLGMLAVGALIFGVTLFLLRRGREE
jgi:hypothetical protein